MMMINGLDENDDDEKLVIDWDMKLIMFIDLMKMMMKKIFFPGLVCCWWWRSWIRGYKEKEEDE
jgi:hypothetical protein